MKKQYSNLEDYLSDQEWAEYERMQRQSNFLSYVCAVTIVSAMLLLALFCGCAHAEVYSAAGICEAIYIVEGGARAKKPYGVLSIPCNSHESCREVCITTVQNQFTRWQAVEKSRGEFLVSLARRYAPVGAGNDPKNLNQYWLKNLLAVLRRQEVEL